jgi:hypothetical protein
VGPDIRVTQSEIEIKVQIMREPQLTGPSTNGGHRCAVEVKFCEAGKLILLGLFQPLVPVAIHVKPSVWVLAAFLNPSERCLDNMTDWLYLQPIDKRVVE